MGVASGEEAPGIGAWALVLGTKLLAAVPDAKGEVTLIFETTEYRGSMTVIRRVIQVEDVKIPVVISDTTTRTG